MENKEYITLDEIRQFCSDWICGHFGKEHDTTPWMDKWRLYGMYAAIGAYEERQTMNIASYIRQEEIKNETIRHIRQNE